MGSPELVVSLTLGYNPQLWGSLFRCLRGHEVSLWGFPLDHKVPSSDLPVLTLAALSRHQGTHQQTPGQHWPHADGWSLRLPLRVCSDRHLSASPVPGLSGQLPHRCRSCCVVALWFGLWRNDSSEKVCLGTRSSGRTILFSMIFLFLSLFRTCHCLVWLRCFKTSQ